MTRKASSSGGCGTLFPDEVGDMSSKTQAKVLRVLEGSASTVGAMAPSKSTCGSSYPNKNLEREIELGYFREDVLPATSSVRSRAGAGHRGMTVFPGRFRAEKRPRTGADTQGNGDPRKLCKQTM
jgi:hypothetical protein